MQILTNVVANLALPLVSLATGPLLARALGVEGRGALAAVVAPLVLATTLFTMGLPDSLVYNLARRVVSVRTATRVAIELSLGLGAVAAVAMFIVAPVLLRDTPANVALMRALALTLPFLLLAVAVRCIVQGQQMFGLMVRERLLLAFGRLVALVLLAIAGALNVLTASVATVLMPLIAALALLPGLVRGPPARAAAASFATLAEGRRRVVGYGLRSSVGSTAGALTARLDQVLLAPLGGVSQLGLYVVAVSLAEIPGFALNAVRDVIYARSTSRDDPALLARALRCVIVLALPASLIGILLIPIVLPLLFGPDFVPAVPLAQLALLGISAESMRSLLGTGLLSLGRPGLQSTIEVVSVLITVLALLLLIPPLGASGAAIAMLGARLLSAAAYILTFTRLSGVPVRACLLPQRGDVRDLWMLARGLARAPRRSP